jgi:hypothetical protein
MELALDDIGLMASRDILKNSLSFGWIDRRQELRGLDCFTVNRKDSARRRSPDLP